MATPPPEGTWGTAKGASIVALGTGDGASIFAAVEGLEWTYQHSRPGLNEYNIRVVSNSWGTNGDYNPNNAVTLLTDMLTYDNGVAVIFAASNSGAVEKRVKMISEPTSMLIPQVQFQLPP